MPPEMKYSPLCDVAWAAGLALAKSETVEDADYFIGCYMRNARAYARRGFQP